LVLWLWQVDVQARYCRQRVLTKTEIAAYVRDFVKGAVSATVLDRANIGSSPNKTTSLDGDYGYYAFITLPTGIYSLTVTGCGVYDTKINRIMRMSMKGDFRAPERQLAK
jgi:hypothetical protein